MAVNKIALTPQGWSVKNPNHTEQLLLSSWLDKLPGYYLWKTKFHYFSHSSSQRGGSEVTHIPISGADAVAAFKMTEITSCNMNNPWKPSMDLPGAGSQITARNWIPRSDSGRVFFITARSWRYKVCCWESYPNISQPDCIHLLLNERETWNLKECREKWTTIHEPLV